MSYIEREAVLAEYDRQHKGPPGKARRIIESWPAANVTPIVYCKDCYWWYADTTTDGTIDVSHCERGVSAGNGRYFYCALGQRRSHDISG